MKRYPQLSSTRTTVKQFLFRHKRGTLAALLMLALRHNETPHELPSWTEGWSTHSGLRFFVLTMQKNGNGNNRTLQVDISLG